MDTSSNNSTLSLKPPNNAASMHATIGLGSTIQREWERRRNKPQNLNGWWDRDLPLAANAYEIEGGWRRPLLRSLNPRMQYHGCFTTGNDNVIPGQSQWAMTSFPSQCQCRDLGILYAMWDETEIGGGESEMQLCFSCSVYCDSRRQSTNKSTTKKDNEMKLNNLKVKNYLFQAIDQIVL